MSANQIFVSNLKRAKEALSWEIPQGGRGKPPEFKYDLYRLSLVYGFAALENYLKTLLENLFEKEIDNKLKTLRLVDDQGEAGPSVSLDRIDSIELQKYKEKLLKDKKKDQLKKTLTNPGKLAEAITRLLEGSKPLDSKLLKEIQNIAVRRNQIVHVLDRQWAEREKKDKNGNSKRYSQFVAKALTKVTSEKYLDTIEQVYQHMKKYFKNPTHKKRGRKPKKKTSS